MQSKNCDDEPALDNLFRPRSIAIAGVSTEPARFARLGGGRLFLEILIKVGFKGRLYPVNPSGGEMLGLKIYPSIKDIPGQVDYVISSVPAQHTPQLILDCADKGVKAVHVFAAGFAELGDEKGKQLERQVTAIAQERGIRIIGPNCMGLYCPRTNLSFCLDFPKEGGSVGYIAQSGGHSQYGVLEAATRGIRFSKVISYGNACDLDESDFLEYFTQDPETKIVAAYIEGVKDGRRFTQVLKQLARLKPVVVFKGGATETGARTVASHTGAIAGSDRIWASLLKQAGAIQVHSIEELVDVVLLFRYMSPPEGRNIAVIGLGGGASVQAADECSRAGLVVPVLPAETNRKLKGIVNNTEAGSILKNPIDIYSRGSSQPIREAINIVAGCSQIDLLIIHISFDFYPVPEVRDVEPYVEALISLSQQLNKRTAVVLDSISLPQSKQAASEVQTALYKAGFPVYPSVAGAANAIAKFIEYYHRAADLRLARLFEAA